MALLGSAKDAPGPSEDATGALGWFLFFHDASDCYFWVKDPTIEDFQGDGEVLEVTGVEHHEYSAQAYGVVPPVGWVDPLVAGPEHWAGQEWI